MLTLDYANCTSERVGVHGLDPARLGPGSEAAASARSLTETLANTRGTDWERWRELWNDPMRGEHVAAVYALVNERASRFENLVVLGIGGSALGNIALQSALNPPTWNLLGAKRRGGPRMFVIDNVDPANFRAIMDVCPPKETLYNVISKSGETAETAAQFMIIRDMLADAVGKKASDHVVAVTDPEKGTMRQICNDAGYATLPVPEGVGGRFSVLSPVGLFSAAMCGIDIEGLLDGAAAMDARCASPDLAKNPAAMLATLLCELAARKGKTNHVMMPYANALYLMADWYRQLWAESLGKKFSVDGEAVYAGFTPIKALGTTDQHSQVQLYREGPNDKVIMFLEVERFEEDQEIPAGLGVENLKYLEGASMTALLNAEKRATEYALVESERPNLTISFPRIDAPHVGEFIALWEITTAYAGHMLGVDAYDQPAVETGKKATFGLMGREGFGEWKTRVEEGLGKTDLNIES
ncbi:MAG: glucose-6-phosphate isomerase [Phycisphaerales bacterium]